MSQNINEWLSGNLFVRGDVSCQKVIQIVVDYTLSVTVLCFDVFPKYPRFSYLDR